MPNTNRFFIIRSDGTSSTVTGEQLNTMRLNGFVGPDDKVVPIPNQTVLNNLVVQPSEFNPISTALNQVEPATDDLDTAPLSPHLLLLDKNNEKPSSHRFDNIEDFEIDLAFSTATSQSLYQMNAEEADLALPLAKDNLVQDTTQIPAKDKTLYNILFSDGRVLGPFDEQNIWERFSQSMLSGNEQIALAGSENYKPILDYIEFRAAFKTFNEKDFNKAKTHTIDMASIAPFLLQLSHDLATGWLIVKHETQTYVLSFAVGRIIHIRSNQPTQNQPDNMLKPIFSLESGIAWFETDPFVASDERMVFQDVLSLSRQLTNVKNGFSLSRILQTIGDQNRTLQLKSANQWKTSVDQLITLEKSVLTPAEQGKTTHETLRSLIALKYSEEDCLHALFMVIIAGCISTIEESITLEIKEFTHKLFSSHFVDLLPLSSSSEDNFVFKELETLKNRIANTAKLLPQKDPLIKEMEDRFHYIKQLILNKTERYVLFKAFEENIDLEKKPDQAFALKKEYLEKAVRKAILEHKYLEILPEAELYYELCPDNPEALSYLLLTRFFAASNTVEQKPTLDLIKTSLKRFSKSEAVYLAATTIYIKAGYFSGARSCLKTLQKIIPGDKRVLALKQTLNNELLQPYVDKITASSPWLNIAFASLVTLAMTGFLWLISVDLELGKTETLSQEVDYFIWIRALVLSIFTGMGFFILHRQGLSVFFRRLTYRMSWIWGLISCLFGIIVAILFDINDLANIKLNFITVVSLLAAVFFDRLYFSGFLGQDLIQTVKHKWLGVCAITLLYTVYYFTFYELMVMPYSQILMRFAIICFAFSLPLILLQFFSKSILAPFLFQLLFFLTEAAANFRQ